MGCRSPSLTKPSLKLAKLDPLRWNSGTPQELADELDAFVNEPPSDVAWSHRGWRAKHGESGVWLKGPGQSERRFAGPEEARDWLRWNLAQDSAADGSTEPEPEPGARACARAALHPAAGQPAM